MIGELAVVLVLMLLNGVFAAAEIAVLSVRKTRLAELATEGRRGAAAVGWLRAEPERFLATVQIGLTVIGTTAAAFGGEALAHDVGHMLRGVPGVGAYAPTLGLVVVIAGISFLEIVVGELVPKSLALRMAERFALLLAPPLRTMATVVRPLVWVLTGASNVVLKLFGDKTSFTETRLSPEEIQELVEEAARVGSLDPGASEIASRAIDFQSLRAVDAMVPRAAVVMVSRDASVEALAAVVKAARFSRLPVYEGSEENVVGYVTLRDLLGPALRGEAFALSEHVRPIKFAPGNAHAVALLRDLQGDRTPLAMLVDEVGTVVGLVTVEDLVEELVGEILSENDPAPIQLKRDDDGSYLVQGGLAVHVVNRSIDFELPESERYSTLAGLCIVLAGHIPHVGEVVAVPGGASLEVVEASARRVKVVRVRRPAA
ncbi:MAG: putative hemolysin [Myxococcaceae bacterium]|nr:putative hemolysin [Myxococcaceae bacterium]